MRSINQYQNPFQAIKDFENLLRQWTGAPYAIVTDCCTHAMEIALRIQPPTTTVQIPCRTYLSVIMLMHKLDINYQLIDHDWYPSYQLGGTKIWDCARYFEKNMYQSGTIQCLSFNRGKPLSIGTGGVILTDDPVVADRANRMRYDGRDIFSYSPWIKQENFDIGFHYYLRPEDCVTGLNLLENQTITPQPREVFDYPDCRTIKINMP